MKRMGSWLEDGTMWKDRITSGGLDWLEGQSVALRVGWPRGDRCRLKAEVG